jgi:hypothetical protein
MSAPSGVHQGTLLSSRTLGKRTSEFTGLLEAVSASFRYSRTQFTGQGIRRYGMDLTLLVEACWFASLHIRETAVQDEGDDPFPMQCENPFPSVGQPNQPPMDGARRKSRVIIHVDSSRAPIRHDAAVSGPCEAESHIRF